MLLYRKALDILHVRSKIILLFMILFEESSLTVFHLPCGSDITPHQAAMSHPDLDWISPSCLVSNTISESPVAGVRAGHPATVVCRLTKRKVSFDVQLLCELTFQMENGKASALNYLKYRTAVVLQL